MGSERARAPERTRHRHNSVKQCFIASVVKALKNVIACQSHPGYGAAMNFHADEARI